LINKNNGKGVNPSMFRKIGTFIYHRSERTWCREARATYGWANRSYDNRSRNTRAIEEEFSMKNLPGDFDLQILPSLDDIHGNPELIKDYATFVNGQTDGLFDRCYIGFKSYLGAPIGERKPLLEKLMVILGEAAVAFPAFDAAQKIATKVLAGRERISDSFIRAVAASCTRSCAVIYYQKWIVEHASVWKSIPWTPVPAALYGEFHMLIGMSTVGTKIEEAALKGKSGFSRFLAKRQLKKQGSMARSSVKVSISDKAKSAFSSPDVFVGIKTGPQTVDINAVAVVPTVNETLSSLFLRKFMECIVFVNLEGPERALWDALFHFYKKYDSKLNEALIDAQDEMLKDILGICDKFKDILPGSEELKERAKKQKFLFPQFFRPVELELYSKYHAEFEESLRKRGWK